MKINLHDDDIKIPNVFTIFKNVMVKMGQQGFLETSFKQKFFRVSYLCLIMDAFTL